MYYQSSNNLEWKWTLVQLLLFKLSSGNCPKLYGETV
jgi:hypothetical protein